MENLTLVASLAFLAATSVLTHTLHQAWIGFALAPVPLLFYRQDAFRMMVLALSTYLLFYEAFMPSSNFLWFNTQDSLLIVYIAMTAFFSPNLAVFSIPMSAGLVPLYAFILYGFALSIQPIMEFGFDFYVMRDVKCLLFLCLVPLMCRKGEALFNPKNAYRILLAIIVFTSVHSIVLLFGFFTTGNRVTTWNEIFFSDSVLIAPILLTLHPEKRIRRLLLACLPICLIGLLATQTRGLWLSTLFSFATYIGIRLFKSRTLKISSLLKGGMTALAILCVGEIILRVAMGRGLYEFVISRMMSMDNHELVNPYSSLGYRIHESLVVWDKRTWFGHGSGARLYLFFTQLGMSKFINWWSIHSEYFEILHKYGFIGLGIFMTFLATLMRRAYRIAVHGKAFPSALGFVAFTTLLNHCLVSITSGYIIRENVMLYLVILVGIVERYYPRVFPSLAAPAATMATGLAAGSVAGAEPGPASGSAVEPT